MEKIDIVIIGTCSFCDKKVIAHTDPKKKWKGSPVLTNFIHEDGSKLCANDLGFVRINGKDLLKIPM